MPHKKVSVIGAGKWGSAIADLLAQKAGVILYSRSTQTKSWHKNITITNDLSDVAESHYIFVAIPAQQVKSFFEQVTKISQDAVIILCSKGVDITTGKLLSHIVEDGLPQNDICILSGPNFSNEVMNKVLTISTIASRNLKVAQGVAQAFSTDYFKFLPSDDIISTQVCGALKNVLAIACGVIRGLEMGENAVAAVLTIGIDEIIQVIKKFGGKIEGITSAAGIGDIFLSCNSSTSRNNDFGVMLATGKDINPGVVVEGKHTIIALSENYYDMVKTLPLLDFVYQLSTKKLFGKERIRNGFLKIFN